MLKDNIQQVSLLIIGCVAVESALPQEKRIFNINEHGRSSTMCAWLVSLGHTADFLSENDATMFHQV